MLFSIGLDYKKLSIEKREKFTFTTSQKESFANYLKKQGIEELIILATCNRTEFYIGSQEKSYKNQKNIIFNAIKEKYKIKPENYFAIYKEKSCVKHLFRVSSGLDSLVLGEDQILGQVKSAYDFFLNKGYTKKILNKLFLNAITVAKSLKTKYKISEKPLSVSYIGIEFLKDKLDNLDNKNILLIGLGKMGRLVFENLKEKPPKSIHLSNRSHGKIVKFKEEYSFVNLIDYKKRYEYINEVDCIISATASPHVIFKNELLKKYKDEEKKLTFLDLALPRDIDPEISKLKNIDLYNIDDLKKISKRNSEKRKKLAKKMEDEIDKKVEEFINWKKTIKADHFIGQINNRCEEINKRYSKILINKLNVDNSDKEIIEKMVGSALKKVIQKPIVNLKSMDCENKVKENVEVLENLFEV
ncbi:MAG: glutamyl-tRNA reductase [Bacillota bacterium]